MRSIRADTPAGKNRVLRFGGFALLALTIGAVHAIQLRFVNDDAFISFRYVRNLVNGFGMVYNIGEKVEGYTNFLS